MPEGLVSCQCACGKILKVPEDARGTVRHCPACGKSCRIPSKKKQRPPPPGCGPDVEFPSDMDLPAVTAEIRKEFSPDYLAEDTIAPATAPPGPELTGTQAPALKCRCACGHVVQFSKDARGTLQDCPACGKRIRIPSGRTKRPPPPDCGPDVEFASDVDLPSVTAEIARVFSPADLSEDMFDPPPAPNPPPPPAMVFTQAPTHAPPPAPTPTPRSPRTATVFAQAPSPAPPPAPTPPPRTSRTATVVTHAPTPPVEALSSAPAATSAVDDVHLRIVDRRREFANLCQAALAKVDGKDRPTQRGKPEPPSVRKAPADGRRGLQYAAAALILLGLGVVALIQIGRASERGERIAGGRRVVETAEGSIAAKNFGPARRDVPAARRELEALSRELGPDGDLQALLDRLPALETELRRHDEALARPRAEMAEALGRAWQSREEGRLVEADALYGDVGARLAALERGLTGGPESLADALAGPGDPRFPGCGWPAFAQDAHGFLRQEREALERKLQDAGMIRHQGGWIAAQETPRLEREAQGLVKYEGQWIPRAQRDGLVARKREEEALRAFLGEFRAGVPRYEPKHVAMGLGEDQTTQDFLKGLDDEWTQEKLGVLYATVSAVHRWSKENVQRARKIAEQMQSGDPTEAAGAKALEGLRTTAEQCEQLARYYADLRDQLFPRLREQENHADQEISRLAQRLANRLEAEFAKEDE